MYKTINNARSLTKILFLSCVIFSVSSIGSITNAIGHSELPEKDSELKRALSISRDAAIELTNLEQNTLSLAKKAEKAANEAGRELMKVAKIERLLSKAAVVEEEAKIVKMSEIAGEEEGCLVTLARAAKKAKYSATLAQEKAEKANYKAKIAAQMSAATNGIFIAVIRENGLVAAATATAAKASIEAEITAQEAVKLAENTESHKRKALHYAAVAEAYVLTAGLYTDNYS